MAKQNNPSSGTNVQKVKKQNAQSAQGQKHLQEFASETDVQEVKQQIQQAEAKKQKNS